MAQDSGPGASEQQRRHERVGLAADQASTVEVLPATIKQMYEFSRINAEGHLVESFAEIAKAVYEDRAEGYCPEFVVLDPSEGGASLACRHATSLGTSVQFHIPEAGATTNTRGQVVGASSSPETLDGREGDGCEHGIKLDREGESSAGRMMGRLRGLMRG